MSSSSRSADLRLRRAEVLGVSLEPPRRLREVSLRDAPNQRFDLASLRPRLRARRRTRRVVRTSSASDAATERRRRLRRRRAGARRLARRRRLLRRGVGALGERARSTLDVRERSRGFVRRARHLLRDAREVPAEVVAEGLRVRVRGVARRGRPRRRPRRFVAAPRSTAAARRSGSRRARPRRRGGTRPANVGTSGGPPRASQDRVERLG